MSPLVFQIPIVFDVFKIIIYTYGSMYTYIHTFYMRMV